MGRRYVHVRWWVEVVSSRTGAGWEVQIVVELYDKYICIYPKIELIS